MRRRLILSPKAGGVAEAAGIIEEQMVIACGEINVSSGSDKVLTEVVDEEAGKKSKGPEKWRSLPNTT